MVEDDPICDVALQQGEDGKVDEEEPPFSLYQMHQYELLRTKLIPPS